MPLKIIYSDGGCDCRDRVGGWAYIILNEDGTKESTMSGYEYDTTNNRMEMIAVINAITSLPINSEIIVRSDSAYVVRGNSDPNYLEKWYNNGWKTSKRKPVENQDLWSKFILINTLYRIAYQLVPGHSKDPLNPHKKYNDACDSMCTEMMRVAREGN
jgi:ribonuclease HI